jgi:tRNA pseudouridine38-40 synthase
VTQQPITVWGAGRTDSGVHASGQVIAFDAAWRHTTDDLWRAINANLPDDIALQTLGQANADFHPRYDAQSRVYDYALYAARVRQPLLNNMAWHVPGRLDVEVMQRAADCWWACTISRRLGSRPRVKAFREVRRSNSR